MTAAQQIAELQQRIQALEFSCHETEKQLDSAAFLGAEVELRLRSTEKERDALRAEGRAEGKAETPSLWNAAAAIVDECAQDCVPPRMWPLIVRLKEALAALEEP